ncbi:hypothetical protein MKK63_30820 [Methylobacterium sp. J-088]|uniref:hypothetical protein n=1 Tax=Methylobacterium sp. J-088 TaxID=2836664 RepID=UPI001FB87154|nr:hypothetical protein [Methylobacterium sp. J-088]MCJ2067051.1 hypothetical protein [Methylobacterium sp. J-088]
MTQFHTYENRGRVGRTKEWEKRLTLPLTSEMVERLDAAKLPGEDRLAVIRKGIERELKHRSKRNAGKTAEASE